MSQVASGYALLMAGQFSECEGMGLPVASDPGYAEAAARFDGLTGGAFTPWVTLENAEALGRHSVASRAVVLFDAALGEAAGGRWGRARVAAGYSLGFYAAAVVAGCFGADVALEWIRRNNGAMARIFPEGSFATAVCVGLTREELEAHFASEGLGGLKVANVNNARQVVYAGPPREVEASLSALGGKVLQVRQIPVPYPLHTAHMGPVAEAVTPWWEGVEVRPPEFPLLSPVDGSELRTAREVHEVMPVSLRTPTDWVAVVRAVAGFRPAWVLDTSGDGSLGRMTRWVDRELKVVHYAEAFAGGGG